MIIRDEYSKDVNLVRDGILSLEALHNKTILITGASGLIGSSVADLLFALNKKGFKINILLAGRNQKKISKRFEYIEQSEYSFIPLDLENDEEINLNTKVDFMIHCAGSCSPWLYSIKPVETLYGCIAGTWKILEYNRTHDNSRVVYVSSSEVYGNNGNQNPFSETDFGYVDLLNSRSCYPEGKRSAETLCASYIHEYNSQITIVRPGHVYGAPMPINDDRAPAQFIRSARNLNKIIMKSDGLQLRSYCNSLDVASAILWCLVYGKIGEAYNISNKDSIITVREFAETIASIMNVAVEFEMPTDIERKGYNIMMNSSLDASKLESLGWQARIDLRTGVRQMIECFES